MELIKVVAVHMMVGFVLSHMSNLLFDVIGLVGIVGECQR